MTSKSLALLLADLGIVKTHSRPYVCDDNPFSEAHFKTLKYRPGYPDRFGSIEDARRFCQEFFPWYNRQDHHSGLNLLTPPNVHYGQATQVISSRQSVLDAAYRLHPERFVRRAPRHSLNYYAVCLIVVDTFRFRPRELAEWLRGRACFDSRKLPLKVRLLH